MGEMFLRNRNVDPDSFSLLKDAVTRYCAPRAVTFSENSAYTVSVSEDPSFADGEYRLIPTGSGADVVGSDRLACHAGVGRLLREMRFDGRGGYAPLTEPVSLIPACPIRGMYYATHFHNFHHAAPLERVCEQIGDLALSGCNELLVWFDLHHYASMDDPEAVAMVSRLREILAYANRIGIGACLLTLANEGFDSSPAHLRARFEKENGYRHIPRGHYAREICPSVPGGTEEILRERREMLTRFAGLKIDYVICWPYDQGGCTCAKCAPWGANGYLDLFPRYRDLVREFFPDAKMILSTWFFDRFTDGEWDGFLSRLERGSLSGAEYVMCNGIPEEYQPRCRECGVKWLTFPEISMEGCAPWGGFGASALPDSLRRNRERMTVPFAGGFPYSEGIFEDVNKWICLSGYTGEYPDPADAVRAYLRCFFGRDDDDLFQAILRSETGLARDADGEGKTVRYRLKDPSAVKFVYETFRKYDASLPDPIRNDFRFRLWYLRATVDFELMTHGGDPFATEVCRRALKEIDEIYGVTRETNVWVRSPLWRITGESDGAGQEFMI